MKDRQPKDGRCRAVIEGVYPEIEAGRHPIKRVAGERVVVRADIFADGHDTWSAVLKFRREPDATRAEVPMEPLGNDRWQAEFTVGDPGVCRYTLEAWVDHFKSWRSDLQKRIKAGQDVSVELVAGAQLVEAAAGRATGEEAKRLRSWAKEFAGGDAATLPQRSRRALDDAMAALMTKHPDRRFATNCRRE